MLTWSALSVFMRSFSQKYDALTVTTCGIYVAAIGTLPLMLREIITHPEMDFLHAKYILVLFYVAIFCTTIPHSLWNYCLSVQRRAPVLCFTRFSRSPRWCSVSCC